LDYTTLIAKERNNLSLLLELLEKGDIRDATKKACRSVENIRKTLLVAVKTPYDTAKTITNGTLLFSKILSLYLFIKN